MEINPTLQIALEKLSEVIQKASKVMSFKIAGYAVGAGFISATVISVATSGILFSLQSDRVNTRSGSLNDDVLNQEVSLSDSDIKSVLKRNIFNKEGTLGGESEIDTNEEEKIVTDQIVKSTLPLKLWGTIYGGDPVSGIAMIEDTRKKTTNSFMVGDRLTDNAVMKQILKEKIIFERNGQLEYIELEKEELVRRKRGQGRSSGPSSVTPDRPRQASGRLNKFKEDGYEFGDGKIKMTNEYKQKLITTDFSKVLQDAKAEPNMVEGRLQGFKLTRIRSPSIYEKSGLKNGDIVTEINGVELTSASQAIRTLQSLRTANQIEVTVIQDGVKNTLEISIGQ